jgi:hypothetical protein
MTIPEQYKKLKLPEKMQQDIHQVWHTMQIIDQSESKNFLSFSVGYDSPFWHREIQDVRKGKVIFLEHELGWMDVVRREHKALVIHPVTYSTIIDRDFFLLETHRASWCERLPMKLPEDVRETSWDVVMVDGPQGHADNPMLPGRFQSLFEAARLVNTKTGYIVVDDCSRVVERLFGDLFFGAENLISSVPRRRKKTDRVVFPNSQCIYKATERMPALRVRCEK